MVCGYPLVGVGFMRPGFYALLASVVGLGLWLAAIVLSKRTNSVPFEVLVTILVGAATGLFTFFGFYALVTGEGAFFGGFLLLVAANLYIYFRYLHPPKVGDGWWSSR